jgi:hypothetical protein
MPQDIDLTDAKPGYLPALAPETRADLKSHAGSTWYATPYRRTRPLPKRRPLIPYHVAKARAAKGA